MKVATFCKRQRWRVLRVVCNGFGLSGANLLDLQGLSEQTISKKGLRKLAKSGLKQHTNC